jgi:phenylalanine-4-hydroxylase
MIQATTTTTKQQVYANYTAEDFKVWKLLYNRQIELLQTSAVDEYLKGLQAVDMIPERIPDFTLLNQHLADLTAWHIIPFEGICPPAKFFKLLAQRIFPCTHWLRRMDQMDYLEEPDMFHDVFGHIPLLSNKNYCNFFNELGTIGAMYQHHQHIIDKLERLYWFTIEFGLMKEAGQIKIYGSGIGSSFGELKHAVSNQSTKKKFNLVEIMNHEFRTDVIQDEYYVIENFTELVECLPEVRSICEAEVRKVNN